MPTVPCPSDARRLQYCHEHLLRLLVSASVQRARFRTGNLSITGPRMAPPITFGDGTGDPVHIAHQRRARRAGDRLRSDARRVPKPSWMANSISSRATRSTFCASFSRIWARAAVDAVVGEGDRRPALRLPAPAAGQYGGARKAQRAASLRPVRRALQSLPRYGHAVLLRLFRAARHDARGGAGRQEAPYRRQAADQAGPERARHRLGLGRARTLPCARRSRPTCSASRCRPSSMPSPPSAPRPKASTTACISRSGTTATFPSASTASSRSACSSMSASTTTAPSSTNARRC